MDNINNMDNINEDCINNDRLHEYEKSSLARKSQVQSFLEELETLCRKYNVSISHEDIHGAFILTPFDKGTMEWLAAANYGFWEYR